MALLLFTCGPLLLTIVAWWKIWQSRKVRKPDLLEWIATGTVCAIALYTATTYAHYTLFPPQGNPPPWKDPLVLDMGLLILLAPMGMAVAFAAVLRGGSKWAFWILEVASGLMFLLGLMAGVAV